MNAALSQTRQTTQTMPGLQSEQLESLQHFIELGRLSASLLHEISSPLTAALLYLDQADDTGSVNVRHIRRSLNSLRSYVEAARQQLRHQNDQVSSFCIHPQIEQVKRLVLPLARAEGVTLVFEDEFHYQLRGSPVKFQQILANLIINALDAYDNTIDGLMKPIRVQISGSSNSLCMKVIDWGKGIKAGHLPLLFEPFFSTKSVGQKGLGIGLTIVKEHVTRDFQGSIRVSSSPRSGTRFVVTLPAILYSANHFRKKPH